MAAPPVRPLLQLFRRVMRAHRAALPSDMRALGDAYARDEFRRHAAAAAKTTAAQWASFGHEWSDYAATLEGAPAAHGAPDLGDALASRLSPDQLSPDQRATLQRLRDETTALGLGGAAEARPPA